MNSPIDLTGMQPASGARPKFDPYTGAPLDIDDPEARAHERIEEQFVQNPAGLVGVPSIERPPVAANPYAPTGWKRRNRVEFDLNLPSGQLCRAMRLEREDLFAMNLIQYLDTFTPQLMKDSNISEEEQQRRMQEVVKKDPNKLADMFIAIDQVVMAATIKPRVTNDDNLVDYGQPSDWGNPNFIPTAHINDIKMEDRMAIFGAVFGVAMDDLKSVWQQAAGMGSVANEPSLPATSEPSL